MRKNFFKGFVVTGFIVFFGGSSLLLGADSGSSLMGYLHKFWGSAYSQNFVKYFSEADSKSQVVHFVNRETMVEIWEKARGPEPKERGKYLAGLSWRGQVFVVLGESDPFFEAYAVLHELHHHEYRRGSHVIRQTEAAEEAEARMTVLNLARAMWGQEWLEETARQVMASTDIGYLSYGTAQISYRRPTKKAAETLARRFREKGIENIAGGILDYTVLALANNRSQLIFYLMATDYFSDVLE